MVRGISNGFWMTRANVNRVSHLTSTPFFPFKNVLPYASVATHPRYRWLLTGLCARYAETSSFVPGGEGADVYSSVQKARGDKKAVSMWLDGRVTASAYLTLL